MLKTAVRILKYGYHQEKRRISTQRHPNVNSVLRDAQPVTTSTTIPSSAGASLLGTTTTTVTRPGCPNPNPGSQGTAPHSSSRPIPSTSDSTLIIPSSDLSPSSSTPASSSATSASSSLFSEPQRGSDKIEMSKNNPAEDHVISVMYPKLEQISIRWAREKCANHLKQEGTYDVIYADDDYDEDDEGDYAGASGRGDTRNRVILALEAAERGIPAVGKPFLRRYRYSALNFGRRRRGKGSFGLS